MGLKISGLNELRERLERLRPEEVMARALAEQAARMAERVQEGLSEPPGTAGHDEPWLRSGALRDSVGAEADGLQAVVGSSDPAAVPQELGTARMPARPFLVPVAAGMGEEVARAVGAAAAAALRGDSTDANGTGVDLGGGSLGANGPPSWSGTGAETSTTSSSGFTLASGSRYNYEPEHAAPDLLALDRITLDAATSGTTLLPRDGGSVTGRAWLRALRTLIDELARPVAWFGNEGRGELARAWLRAGRMLNARHGFQRDTFEYLPAEQRRVVLQAAGAVVRHQAVQPARRGPGTMLRAYVTQWNFDQFCAT